MESKAKNWDKSANMPGQHLEPFLAAPRMKTGSPMTKDNAMHDRVIT